MALTTSTLHGQILDPNGLTPAVGTVTFRTLIELRDVVANVIYSPATFTATLDVNGEFTIVLPATDNPDLVPTDWIYQVYVNAATWQETFYVQLPFFVGITELADLPTLDYNPCTGLAGATPVTPDESDLFVRKTGDTMTGNLGILANLSVSGAVGITGLLTGNIASIGSISGANLNYSTGHVGALTTAYDGDTLSVGQLLAMGLSTAPTGGGEFNPNVDPTKLDITAMTGFIVNYNVSVPLSPTNPSITPVTLPAQTGLTPAFAPITWWMVDAAGAIVQQATRPTPTQRRQNILLGVTATIGGVIIVDQTLPVIPSQVSSQLVDLMDALGPFSTTGNLLSANGVNLNINKTVGMIFARAFSQVPTYQDPHNATLAAQTPMQYRHVTRVAGSAGALVTALNVGFFDSAGVVTPVGGGGNTSTNFRVWGFANNTVTEQILIQYGQTTFASLAAAREAIPAGAYTPNPATADGALLGWISVIRTATDLSDPAQAAFTKASKFATP